MAFPLLALALALSAAGAGANYVGARKADAAQADAMRAERARSKRSDEQAKIVNENSRKRYEGIEGQQDKKAAALEDLFQPGAEDTPEFVSAPTSSNITIQNEASERAKSRDYTGQQGKARAEMLSFGDLFGDIGRGEARDMTRLAGIQGERRGSQSVLPLELDAAAQAGSGWRLGGDVLGGLGSIATMGALTGGNLPFLSRLGIGGSRPLAGTNMMARGQNPLLSLFG